MNNTATCTSVVVRPVVTWFAAAGAASTYHATPDWALTDFNRLILSAQSLWFRWRPEGTILWQGNPPSALMLSTALGAMLTNLRARECVVSDAGKITGWFTIIREGFPTVHLGIGPLIKQSRTTFGQLDDEPRLLAERLARYADVVGACWRGTAGLSGTASIRAIHEAKKTGQPLWNWKPKYNHMTGCSYELTPSKHSRDLTDAETGMRYVHHFDIRAMYLAAAGVGVFGWSGPQPTGARAFDPGSAGYWQVRRKELDAYDFPVMRDAVYRPGTDPYVWLTTPGMTYLWDCGLAPEVVDSWTCERSGRYLREWATRLTSARQLLDANDAIDSGVLVAVKDTYARTFGMFTRELSRVHRMDWWDNGRDKARFNMLRKVEGADIEPVRYNVDSLWVASDDDADTIGVRLGIPYVDGREVNQVGKFRHVATYSVREYLDTYQRPKVAA